jgi:putative phosphoesterase
MVIRFFIFPISFIFSSKVVHLHHKAKKKMKRIGLLSDTHAFWDEKYLKYFESCDEIWHAGDIGSLEVAEKLAAFRPLRAVYGNIDGQEIRRLFPQTLRFTIEEAEVVMKHIGGYPGNYDRSIIGSLMVRTPKLFISGHSHILKVKYDKTLDMLHINPGAAGNYGFHKVRTLVRFTINGSKFEDMEVVELSD